MRNFKLILLTFTIPLLLNSCGSMVKSSAAKKMTVENGAIPPDLGKDNTVLLCVLKGRNSRDKYMKKHIEKYYKGRYEFILEHEVYESKYSNKEIYRYVFDYNAGSVEVVGEDINGRVKTKNLPTSSYYILDRKTGTNYYSDAPSGYFSKLIEAYAINMEKVRSSNQ